MEEKIVLNEKDIGNILVGHAPDYLRRELEKFWYKYYLPQKEFDNIEITFKLK